MFTAFKLALSQYDSIETVLLNNAGGRVYTARGMALLIEQHNLDTHVDDVCYSACTIAFLAGNQRTLGHAAQLGFHRYSMQEGYESQNIDIEQQIEKDKTYFIERGVAREFVNFIDQANSDTLWKPARQLLIDAGVATR